MSKIFGENLRRLREQAGYKQAKEFAAVVGVPYTTYSSYEKLGREPRYEVLCKIAAALNVSTDELLGYNTPSEERDLFAECMRLVKSITVDYAKLTVSMRHHMGEPIENSRYIIRQVHRGREEKLGDPFIRFASRAEFIAFIQRTMHDFKQSGIYLNARQQFFENALRREEQRQREVQRQKDKSERLEDYEHVLQYLQSGEWTPEQAEIVKRLKELFTEGLNNLEVNSRASLAGAMKQMRDKKAPIGEPPEDEATNRPPASQGRPESGHPGDEVAKSHPVEDEAPKQGVTESPTPEAAPPEQEAPKPRRKRQKNSAPSKNETPSK